MNQIKQLPSLNGWRAVSVMIVLLSHMNVVQLFPQQYKAMMPQIFDGNLAVRFFFVISGFLITYLMIKEEQKTGTVNLKNFYIRRALRILPCYFAYLLVIAIVSVVPKTDWIQLFTFTYNFYQIQTIDLCPHFWSLSIEEQFYAVFPCIFIICGCSLIRNRMAFLLTIVGISTIWKIIALLGLYSSHYYFLFEPRVTFLYLDCLAYGCIAAILMVYKKQLVDKVFAKYGVLITSLSIVFILIPYIAGIGKGVQSLGFVFLMVQSVLYPDAGLYRLLNNKVVMQIGILSYSIYVWHWIIFMKWALPWELVIPASLFAGWVSYRFLEMPFHSLRTKFAKLNH